MRWRDVDDPKAFSAYMETVDARLREQGVDIASRPLHAFGLVSEELKISFMLSSEPAQRINDWFTVRYGDRLKIDWSVGLMLVLIRGDPYVAQFPRVFGTYQVSLLQVLQGVTRSALETLPRAETEALVRLVEEGFEAFHAISTTVPREVAAELRGAVTHAMAGALGLSKWSSQQVVEKVLNAYVALRGGDPRRARKGGQHPHDFGPLVEEARRCGLLAPDATMLSRVACTVNVRYPDRAEARAVTIEHAVQANQVRVPKLV